MTLHPTRRTALAGFAGVAAAAVAAPIVRPARAATKVRFLTSWFAQAEHGGFYQAKATGLYDKAGLDVEIKMGGPQINGLQLLTGGDADLIIGYDIQVLGAVEKGLPVTTVGTSFQFDLQGIMAHASAKSLADLKGKKVLIASTSYTTFWPWLKQKFGYTDEQAAPYTFNLQPFFVDPAVSQQAFITSEPYQAEKAGVPTKFFLFADDGYPPYSGTIVTTRPYMEKNPEVVRAFIKATMEGWKSYFQNPAPANALIKIDNPKETDEQIAYTINKLKSIKALSRGDGTTSGLGIMSDARWKRTRDFLVEGNLLKPTTDYRLAFTTEFVKDLHVKLA